MAQNNKQLFASIWNILKLVAIPSIILFSLWLLAGFLLFNYDCENFITDWVNAAVAIGTIGVVIIAIYQNIQIKKQNLIIEAKKTLFLGIEILDQISHWDIVLIEYMQNSRTDLNLSNKILAFQWEAIFIFGNNERFNKLIYCLEKIHVRYQYKALKLLKEHLLCQPLSLADRQKINKFNEFSDCYITYQQHVKNDYTIQLGELFRKSELFFQQYKKIYVNESIKIISSL